MADTLSCPECSEEVDSAEELEAEHEIPEVEQDDDGSLTLFENRDLCKNCKNPLGMAKR